MSSTNDNTIIPIEQSTNATSGFETNNLFQKEALKKIKTLIAKNMNVSNNYEFPTKKNKFDRYHNAITILGERGTGKTSFLLNLENSCDKKDEFVFLDTLDPTLFEDKQNILISIISLIADTIKDKPENSKKEAWITCLTELSEGLNLLDGVGSNPLQKDIWDDSRIILDKGLNSAHSGINFEKNFHEFVDKSLNLLDDKKLFILRFDDIDTSVLKGWPVLEVIRKYLTTPKIQIIISGDIGLFSKLVRLKQWENLEKLTEFEDKNNLYGTIDQLEEQYLTKILKPENRIYLQSLESILKRKPNSIKIEYEEELELIEDIYNDIAEKVFRLERKRDKETFLNILLKLPVRTNIQILMAYYNSLYIKKEDIFCNYEEREKFLDDFSLVFMTNFTKFDFKYEDTFTLTSHNEEVISYLIDKLIFIKNYKQLTSIKDLKSLQPKFKDKDLNLFLLFLNASVVNTMSKSVSIIFDWYLKKFYLFNIIEEYSEYNEDEIINYLDINYSLIYTSTKINGILYQHNNQYDNFAKIYMQERQVKDGGLGYDTYIKKLKVDLEHDYPIQYKTFSVLHDIIFSKVRIKNDSETYLNVGILNIFSFIGTILNFDANSSNFNDEIKSIIEDKTIGQFTDNKGGDVITEKNDINSENFALFDELKEWVKLKNKIDVFSVSLIEDIWNEFFEREKIIFNVSRVSNYLELQIYVFFNSIFKVIKKYENINSSTRLIRKISKARERFEGNIKDTKYEEIHNINLVDETLKIDFLEYMLLCPIWKYLIDYPNSMDFKYNLLSSDDELNSYANYLNLLSLHQGNIEKKETDESIEKYEIINKENVLNSNDKILVNTKQKKFSRYSSQKVKQVIDEESENMQFDNPDIINIIWKQVKNKFNLNSALDKNKKEDIQNEINRYLENNNG